MKRGTRVEILGWDMNMREVWEPGVIVRKVPMTHYADGSDYPGWHLVKEPDGSRCVMHENRLRVVDNQ